MNKVLIICTSLMFSGDVNMQNVQYASRFRNFSIFSETNAAHVINFQIYQDKLDHKISGSFNVTKDIRVKNIVVVVNRCSLEISACEYFQKWTFTENLKSVVYMNNQMWTPIFEHLTPKLDLPNLKKAIYQTPDASLNTKEIITFYPEVANPNHFWRADAIANDHNGKKAIVLKFEFSIHAFAERKKNRNHVGIKHLLLNDNCHLQ